MNDILLQRPFLNVGVVLAATPITPLYSVIDRLKKLDLLVEIPKMSPDTFEVPVFLILPKQSNKRAIHLLKKRLAILIVC